MDFYSAMKTRRSHYGLAGTSPIADSRIEEILKDAVTYTPSAFHSQSSRVILLLGDRHKKLWSIVMETLRAVVAPEKFAPTEAKILSFSAGHGTVLYFEDMAVVADLQKNMPRYAENFALWSNQSAGMLQYAVWVALSQEGLGASLQHYNPLIDGAVEQEFNVPTGWKLLAQMPFGMPTGQPDPLAYKPIEERFRVEGATK